MDNKTVQDALGYTFFRVKHYLEEWDEINANEIANGVLAIVRKDIIDVFNPELQENPTINQINEAMRETKESSNSQPIKVNLTCDGVEDNPIRPSVNGARNEGTQGLEGGSSKITPQADTSNQKESGGAE